MRWLAALLLCVACHAQAIVIPMRIGGSPINLSAMAHRVTGTAPLAVFFDATATTDASVTSNPFHDIQYAWNFGDSGAGSWSYGSTGQTSKNVAYGAVASHVYETAGTYTVTLTAYDGTNTVTQTQTITVTAANTTYSGANRTCVNASGADHTGCPLIPGTYADSAACVTASRCVTQADLDAALASYLGSGKSVVFKGGDVFTASTHTTFSGTGPAEISSYGTGRAIFRWTGAASALGFIRVGGTGTDFRIVNVEFDGEAVVGQAWMSFQNTAWTNVLLLNNYAHGLDTYISPSWALSGGFGFFVVGNVLADMVAGSGSPADSIFTGSGSLVAILGNSVVQGGNGQQGIRMDTLSKFIVSNNTVTGAAATKETISVRSGSTVDTNFGVIGDNSVSVGPAYTGIFPGGATPVAGRATRNIVVERNYIASVAGTSTTGIESTGEQISIRDNIIDGTAVDSVYGVALRNTYAKDNWVYNNSIYTGKASGAYAGVFVGTSVLTGNVIKNNLVFSPSITATAVSDTGALATKANNTANGSTGVSPLFTATPPTTPAEYRPTVGSYAIDGGTIVPVWSDFFTAARTGTYDMGAVNP